MQLYQTTSKILYVRAGLKPFTTVLAEAGGLLSFLKCYWDFEEIFVPYFRRNRPFWRRIPRTYETNSGMLGKLINCANDSVRSWHPTHSFVGIGRKVTDVLREHDHNKSCFYPINVLAEKYDFSMLLLGCVEESPGFSTVHATQYELGLTQKHITRYLLRWDYESNGNPCSITAKESPGCSLSFNKFYCEYEKSDNLVRGELFGKNFLFVPSARKAMVTEKKILQINPRFVDCRKWLCTTCRLRLY